MNNNSNNLQEIFNMLNERMGMKDFQPWDNDIVNKVGKLLDLSISIRGEETTNKMLEEFTYAAEFVLWADTFMQDLGEVLEAFPEEEFNKPWMGYSDVDTVLNCKWHFLYHRYNIGFQGAFLSFIKNTPTFRQTILFTLNQKFKVHKLSDEEVELYELEVLANLPYGLDPKPAEIEGIPKGVKGWMDMERQEKLKWIKVAMRDKIISDYGIFKWTMYGAFAEKQK